jgi:hypothetical protein
MSILDQILAHLDAYEKADFVAYVEKQSRAKRELELIKILVSDHQMSPEEIRRKLYPPAADGKSASRDAYNGLRKEALNRLYQWIMVTRMESERTAEGRLFALIATGRFMLERNAVDSAAYLFLQAEKLAVNGRHYEVLETIYGYFISHCVEMKLNVDEVIVQWQVNRVRYDRICLLQQIQARQKQSVSNAKKSGMAMDPELNLKLVFKQVKVKLHDANDPAFMHLFCQIIRKSLVSGKDYTGFENFVRRIYVRFKSQDKLTPGDREYELGFLYMYAHAAYRNRKFDLAASLCADMGSLLGERGARQHPLYPKYMALRAGAATYSGKNAEAIELMEQALQHRASNTEVVEWLNNRINLAVYYFQAENYKKAHRILMTINQDSTEEFKLLGNEWCFKKDTIELIVQYELGNAELSLKMCEQVSDRYRHLFGQPLYNRAHIFLNFVRRLLKNPEEVTTPEFMAEVKSAQLAWPGDKEDVQAITFFCWLRAKMQKRGYYEVLLDRLGE